MQILDEINVTAIVEPTQEVADFVELAGILPENLRSLYSYWLLIFEQRMNASAKGLCELAEIEDNKKRAELYYQQEREVAVMREKRIAAGSLLRTELHHLFPATIGKRIQIGIDWKIYIVKPSCYCHGECIKCGRYVL